MKKKMNTLIKGGFVVCALIGLSQSAIGQSLNIKAGTNLSNYNHYYKGERSTFDSEDIYKGTGVSAYDQESSTNYKKAVGMYASITYELNFKNKTSFETGLRYTTKGIKIVDKGTSSLWDNDYSYKYTHLERVHAIDIPIILKFNFYDENVRIYGNSGLCFGAALLGKWRNIEEESMNGVETITETMGDIDLSSQDRNFNAGVLLGLGFEYKQFYLEANYNWGVINLQKMDDNLLISNDLGIALGYKFKFKKKE